MIPFQSLSDELPQLKFDEIIEKIESLQNDDLSTAIKLTSFYDKKVAQFSLEERIGFKKLQAQLYSDQTEYNLAEIAANEGLDLTKQLSHPSIEMAKLLNLRGYSYDNMGDSELAIKDYMSALEIAESLDDDKVVISSLINLGGVYYGKEEFQRSLVLLHKALSLAHKINDDKSLGLVYFELGSLYSNLKLESKVKEFYEQAKIHFTKADEPYLVSQTLVNKAITYAKNKEFLLAISLYERILVKAKNNGNFFALTNIYSKLAQAYLNKPLGEPNTAYQYIISAEKYLNLVKEPSSKMLIGINKADILTKLEKYKEALNVINHAEGMLLEQDDYIRTYSFQEILRIKSDLYYAQGFYKEAHQAQNQYYKNTLELNARNKLHELDDIRIKYESKQHEVQAKILEKKRLIQLQALEEVSENYRERTFFIIICIFTMMSLVWFYSINLKNRKKLLQIRGLDHLTDLPNRQNILLAGSLEYNQAVKNDYSVLIIKIDNFTNINQVKGYGIGNRILIEISLIIMNIIDEISLVGRYSSNEFIVFLPKSSAEKSENVANAIHNTIYRKSWDKYGLKVVSVSIGMSHNISNIESYEALIKTAKTLKQQAVSIGGNTVCTL